MKTIYIFICVFYSSLIFSVNKTFNGPGNFSDATKWGGTLPGAGDNLLINGICTFDNAANNLIYGTLIVGNNLIGTLNWPVSATNTLNVTDVSSIKNANIDMTNGGVLQIRNSWSTNRQTFTPGIGTIIWNVTAAASSLPSTITTYYNLITLTGSNVVAFNVNNPGTFINNNLTVSTGTLNSGGKSFTCSNIFYVTSVFEDISTAGNNTINHLIINSGGIIYNTIGEIYNISGNLTMLGGAISGAGTPVLNVAGNFFVAGGNNDIGNSQLSITGTTSISATLNISALGGTKTFADFIVTPSGSFNCSVAESLSIGGNITINGSFTANAGIYSFTGTGKTISGSTAVTFSNVTCTGTYTNNANVSLTNSLLGTGGTWTQGTSGVLNLATQTTSLLVTNFNASATGNTVNYSRAANQTIRNPTDGSYYNLSSSTSSTKSFTASAVVNGNMAISSSTLDVSLTNYSLSVGGNWVNTAGTFVPRAGTVTFNGSVTQTIFKSAGEAFNNITFSNAGNKTLLSAITANTLTINAGTLTANTNSITLIGNWTNNGGLFVPGTGTVLFTAATAQTIFKSGGETFNNITFSNAGNKSLLSAISGNTLTINAGTLTANTNSITLIGNWTNNGGLFVPATGTVLFTGTTAQSLFKTGGETFNNITFSNAGTKTLLSAITGSNVLINTGSNLDVNTTNNQITVKGNLTNNGTFNTQKGLVFLNGIAAQTIGGTSITDFYNLSLNNNAGANITNAQNLINVLTLSNGTFNTNSLGFTMVSTASNTARIAQITGSGDITGNVNVQRFAPGGRTGWALLGTPISSALTFQDWDDDMPISCTSCPDGSAGGFTSIYAYNEAATGSYSASTGYVPITSITNAIIPNKGYWVYLGTGSSSTSPITIDVTGTVRKFNNSISLTKTNTGSTFDDGWNLIHNPYPSPIKWSLLRAANPNVDNAIYSYNADLNGGAGGTASYVNGISSPALGSGGIGDTIPMCQGFQVHCTASTNLTALESNKVSGNPTFLRTNQTAQVASVQPLLRFYLNGPSSYRDETVLYMQEGATNNFDPDFDAIKIPGQNPNAPLIMFKNGTDQFQVNGINPITSTFSMPLKTTTGYTGTYTISLANFNSFPTGACISLYDTLTKITTDLKINKYVFTLSASATNTRFVVNITINPLNITTAVSQPGCLNPNSGAITAIGNNSGPWNYFWKDASGIIVKTALNKTTADTLLNLTGGDYMLDINTVGQCDNNDSSFTINSIDLVTAQFTTIDTVYLSDGGAINFINNSSNAINNTWDFGDSFGFSSNVDPAYNYYSAGIFTVSLIATSNSGCMDTVFKSVVVMPDISTGLISQNSSGSLLLKTLDENEFILQGNIHDSSPLNIKLYDTLGKLIIDYGNFNAEEINLTIKLKSYNAGIYFLNVEGTNTHKTIKLPLNK
jgi:hypothetical protein